VEALALKSTGICTTCNHIDDCLFRLRNGRPVWFCEEFDDYVKMEAVMPEEMQVEPDGQLRFLGLCLNCEERFTCAYPKPESGVWHCEEYR